MAKTDSEAPCPVCGIGISVRPARGRKSNKPFIMLICPADGRHLRGFITDQAYVNEVANRLEGHTADNNGAPSLRESSGVSRGNLEPRQS